MYFRKLYEHIIAGNFDGIRGVLDYARWLEDALIFLDNFDEFSLHQITGDGPGAEILRQDLVRRLMFYSMLGQPSMMDFRTLLDFVGQFYAIVGKDHPSVTANELRLWQKFSLWHLILHSPISEVLRSYRLRLYLSHREDLDNSDRRRYYGMAGMNSAGDWQIHIEDFGDKPAESLLTRVPSRFLKDNGRAHGSVGEQIDFLREQCRLTDSRGHSVAWDAVDEGWGAPLLKITTPLKHGDNVFVLRVHAAAPEHANERAHARRATLPSWPSLRGILRAA
jgi:hypothetical protein